MKARSPVRSPSYHLLFISQLIMKKSASVIIFSALAAVMSLVPVELFAQPPRSERLRTESNFEGAITFSVAVPQLGDDKLTMITYMKGKKTATLIDMGQLGSQHMYSDLETHTLSIVNGESKSGITMDVPVDTASAGKVDTSSLQSTGKTETINGYKAQEFLATTNAGSMDIWATKDLPEIVRNGMISSMKNNPQAQGTGAFAALLVKGMAPVRITIIKDGQTAATVDLVRFEQKPIDDATMVPAPGVKLTHKTMEEIKQQQSSGIH
jgi:Domain of unknown function (DUF4412)